MDRVAVALDLFPSKVFLPTGTTYAAVRSVIADGSLQLWRLGGSGPEIFATYPIIGPLGGSIGTGVEVPTEFGSAWIEQDGGCGCGSALKIADLFPGRQRVMTGLR